MFWWLYEIVFALALLLASPHYLMRMRRRGGYAQGFMERFGSFNPDKREWLRGMRPVWIHAVSVGEVDLALQIIARLGREAPGLPLVLSTTTSTGHALAQGKLPPGIPVFYYPLDSRFCFGRVHRLLRPRAFVLMEAELWPNHLRYCLRRGVPTMLVNARLSQRFFPRYRRFGFVFGEGFRGFRLVTLQTPGDRDRLVSLGFRREALEVIGSLKYDTASVTDPAARDRLLRDLAPLEGRFFWVAGSTHPGEEKIMLDVFRKLKARDTRWLLVLAPRHAERAQEISSLVSGEGFRGCRRTQLSSKDGDVEVLILDTTGELKNLYERADLIFMGKSLVGRGGQNIIEPGACGKAILFGPNMDNFRDIARDFLEAEGARQVRDVAGLEARVLELAVDPTAREALGRCAKECVQKRQGGLDRTVREILRVTQSGVSASS